MFQICFLNLMLQKNQLYPRKVCNLLMIRVSPTCKKIAHSNTTTLFNIVLLEAPKLHISTIWNLTILTHVSITENCFTGIWSHDYFIHLPYISKEISFQFHWSDLPGEYLMMSCCSLPSVCTYTRSWDSVSSTTHLPVVIPMATTEPLGWKQADWHGSSMVLIQRGRCCSMSQRMTCLS